ncbi:MAG TPA: glycosyltransferase family 1 protein [Bacteroidota bacterium]
MRIAIDGRTITHQRTGVGKYAERTVDALLRLDSANEYILFLVEDSETLHAPNLQKILIPGFHRMVFNRWWENVILPRFLVRRSIDIFFSPAYILPVIAKPTATKFVATIHDLIAYTYPESFTKKMRLWQRIFVQNAAKKADLIIAVSEATKLDLLRYSPAIAENIAVVHHAVEETFRPISDTAFLERAHAKYGLPQRFILTVGTIEPRKNHVLLAKAYSLLPEGIRNQYPLVFAGNLGWYSDRILAEISQIGLGKNLLNLGFVDHEDLPALYNLASLFVYPSLYEGFGYPPLEAMSCGTAVITSNRSSLPEVVGDAAILIDPNNVHQLAHEIERVLTDETILREMREKSIQRAAQFSWKKNAEETLRVFEIALKV